MVQKLMSANSTDSHFRMYKSKKNWLFACTTTLAVAAIAGLSVTTTNAHADTTAATSSTVSTLSTAQPTSQPAAQPNAATTSTTNQGAANNGNINPVSAQGVTNSAAENITSASNVNSGSVSSSAVPDASSDNGVANSSSLASNGSQAKTGATQPASQALDYYTVSTRNLDRYGNVNYTTQKLYTSIKGKMVADGTIVTWPLRVSALPANRAQNLKNHVISETLDNNLEYLHYRAFLKNADGTETDVTNHVTLNRDGQTLIFTDDNYLLNLYNNNRNVQFNLPIIKLVTKVHGQSVVVPNSFRSSYVFNDGDHDVSFTTVSNKVQIETFSPNDTKDVEIGNNVQGDPSTSINNHIVADGSIVTWPMSIGDLPANRAQNVLSHIETDTLNGNLQYQGFHAYLPGANGTLTDVTDHIRVQVNGQKLTFVADSYLINLYNQNKDQAFKMPIIDVLTTVHGDSVVAPNNFESQLAFQDGNGQTVVNKTSNTVQISTYHPTNTKDVELGGNVQGDTNSTINNQMIANGSIVTWPMSSSALPANRVQDLVTHQVTETLDKNLQYMGYKVWLQTADGMQDVTSHVKMTQNGQTLTFTDDDYLLGLYNANKDRAYQMPIIDLVTKVNGDSITAPNQFATKYVYADGTGNTTINVSSNKVQVHTYNPTTHKDVELGSNVHGDTDASVTGQEVAEGTIVTWPMTTSDLPANRAQDIVTHTEVDNLTPDLQYMGYTAWLPGANGQLQDVTAHVKLTQNGQKLTFTDDDYLLKLYNSNKGQAFKMPIIDVVTKTTGNTQLLPNAFDTQFVYDDGNGDTTINVHSNQPNVSTYDPTDHKDVEIGGSVQGDPAGTINGKLIAEGTVVTWPMSTSDLVANRAQDVVSHVTNETLNGNLKVLGYHAYLPGANGQLQDVTSHVQMTQNGQKLTFTDDSYLIGLYNANKGQAFKMPVIDLITQVNGNGDAATIPNTFTSQYVFTDGNGNTTFNTTSNTVTVVTYKPKTTKDVELGDNVHGDPLSSITGTTITDGTIVTWPMSASDLPANREQDLKSHVATDVLNPNLVYKGYTAWLPGADGQLHDVTAHVKLTQNGQTLTFTDDDYLLGLYNADKSKAYKLPIIDLVTKANGNTKLIPNNFNSKFVYSDGDRDTTITVTSNTVKVTTYDPTANKDVEIGDDIQGDTPATINNQLVQVGTVLTYPLTVSDLPANRSDRIKSHENVDTLNDNLSYVSYKAWLPNANGKLQDVTSHVKLTRDGQKLAFTDDDYLIHLYNNTKSAAQKLPIIDLVAKVNATGANNDGKTKVIPNHFDSTITTNDNNTSTTSNTVVIISQNPQAIKDVELGGNVIGDTPASITGTEIADGTIVTWPMSVGSLEANRAQKVMSHSEIENLNDNLTYISYKAWLPDANGKMQDVTDHVQVAVKGQQLTFTDDDYLLNLYNKDPKTAFKLPIIDLVTKVNGDNKIIPNTFVSQFVFNDGKGNTTTTVTSNKVQVSTFGADPTKSVTLGGDVQGNAGQNINDQVVAEGTQLTWPLSEKNQLPANRSQDVKSHVLTDVLDNNLQYTGYKAYLTGADGKLQDVTAHVKLTRDGQKLTFTDDSYLLNLYNQDKKTAISLPVIDLVTTVNGTAKLIPNKFNSEFIFSDGDGDTTLKTTSNKVEVKTYTPATTKDAELGGNVIGDTPNSIAGQMVPDGTVVTWPLSVNALPADRAQDVASHSMSDTLDDNLTFDSFKAYLKDASGKLQDVTSHVKLTQNGQQLTFTDDDYLLGLYNSSKDKEQNVPIIDLVTTVHGDAKLVPNDFDNTFVFKDGDGNTTVKTTSNKVTIKTAKEPAPAKTEIDDQGHDLNNHEVKNGEHINYLLTWDLSNYKGIVATPEMIKKGFFFIDPLDNRALTAGDLNNAEVIDQNGNKVAGISFHCYNSISEAPEFIQQQIKDNHLAGKITGSFVVAQADDPQNFYTKYVQSGAKLRVKIPTIVKDGFVGQFSNVAYQFGFGKATPTNTVTSYVKPQPQPVPQPTPASPAQPVLHQAQVLASPVSTPEAPAAPEQATAMPAQPAGESENKLPQTGNDDSAALLGLAAAAMAGSMAFAALGLKKRRN